MLCALQLLLVLQLTTCVLGKSIYGGMKLDINIGVDYYTFFIINMGVIVLCTSGSMKADMITHYMLYDTICRYQ